MSRPSVPSESWESAVLIEVEQIFVDGGFRFARIRTPVGRAVVRWCGEPDAVVGEYAVEWTVEPDVAWGSTALPAAEVGAAIRARGDHVVLRGFLVFEVDGAAMVEFGGAHAQLDSVDPFPEGIDGTWIELVVRSEEISVYPYRL